MNNVNGSFSLPMPHCTSQLVNDTRFSSIREYLLDFSSLSGSTKLDISDLLPGSVIYRIDLIVLSAFSDIRGLQHNIEVSSLKNEILMNKNCNDPNIVGTYSTDCYKSIVSAADILQVNHDLYDAISGSAILRLYMYTNVLTTAKLLTINNEYYHTKDTVGVDVIG